MALVKCDWSVFVDVGIFLFSFPTTHSGLIVIPFEAVFHLIISHLVRAFMVLPMI